MATAIAAPEQGIHLTPIETQTALVPIRGVTPVIPHKWSEKAKGMMRDKQSGSKVKPQREAKVPEEEAEACTYYLPDGRPGIPAVAFKAAMVGACRLFEGVPMTRAKIALFVEGAGPDQLVALDGPRELREDTPRNQTGVADLRYRYAYFPWSCELSVTFVPSMIDVGSLVTLVNAAGLGGVCDWRPSAPKSHTGTFGRFEFDVDRGIELL